MRVAVICSAGGSAFLEAADACPHVEFFVITDRECGVESGCESRSIPFIRIEAKSNEEFSRRAAAELCDRGVFDLVVMFYSRLVTEPLLSLFPLLNVHPALLPAFPGVGAAKRAVSSSVRFVGVTLHIADAGIDSGPIIAQSCQPVSVRDDRRSIEKWLFVHKVALLLLAIDLAETGNMRICCGQARLNPGLAASDRLNPALTNVSYIQAIQRLQEREGVCFLP